MPYLLCCLAAQLPGDAEVVRAQLRIERKARLAPPAVSSSFAADVAEITGAPLRLYEDSKK